MKKSLDDIFNDDEFGLLDSTPQPKNPILTDEDRLIDAFEELNVFYEKHKRAPSSSSMTEFSLSARLEDYKNDEQKRSLLEPFDKYKLLGKPQKKIESLDDILGDDDLGLLDSDGDDSIFTFKHAPKPGSRKEAEYIARRKSLSDKDFTKYDRMFKQVHKELKTGERKLLPFSDAERNLIEGNFYLVDGLLAYLEVSNAEEVLKKNRSGDRVRLEGRTQTIFENGTISNMLFRSLGKAIQKNGKIITNPESAQEQELYDNAGMVKEEDLQMGWIYVLKTKSDHPMVQNIQNLYKIGLSTRPVEERIKNANKEATYLFSDVEVIAKYKCWNVNLNVLENLIHRFFAKVCLDVDLYDKKNRRYNPREWFVAPLPVIDEAIKLLLNETIVNYYYDEKEQKIKLKWDFPMRGV